jgi:hypothetical protein
MMFSSTSCVNPIELKSAGTTRQKQQQRLKHLLMLNVSNYCLFEQQSNIGSEAYAPKLTD